MFNGIDCKDEFNKNPDLSPNPVTGLEEKNRRKISV